MIRTASLSSLLASFTPAACTLAAMPLAVAAEMPVRVWREQRGLSARALADRAAVSAANKSQLETGRKPGTIDAKAKLARAHGVEMEDLEPWQT